MRTQAVRMAQERRSKYGAVPTTVDGIRFASAKEAKRYGELKLWERSGEIRHVELQPSFDLEVAQHSHGWNYARKVGVWRGDFRYEHRRVTPTGKVRWDVVVEDVKGFKTPVYRLKKKMVEAQYGIEIREV